MTTMGKGGGGGGYIDKASVSGGTDPNIIVPHKPFISPPAALFTCYIVFWIAIAAVIVWVMP